MSTYGFIKDGKIVAPVSMCSRFNGIGGWHLLSDAERKKHNWYPCAIVNEEYDERLHVRSSDPIVELKGEYIVVTYDIAEKSVDAVKQDQKNIITHDRYLTEVSGIVISGCHIETDRTSQTRIAQAHALVSIDPTTKIDWKVGNEWIVLDASTITAMALAIGKHVQECFSKEMRLHKQIDEAETIDDVLKINW